MFAKVLFTQHVLASEPELPVFYFPTATSNHDDTVKLNQLLKEGIGNNGVNSTKMYDAQKFAESRNLDEYYVWHLFEQAKNQREKGAYQLALTLNLEGLKLVEKLQDSGLTTKYYNNIGIIYRKIYDYRKALEFNLKALKLAESRNDSTNMAVALNSIGNSYVSMGRYNNALEYFKKSLKLEQNRKSMTGIAINLNNIGKVYYNKNEYKKALNYLSLSLEINRQINSRRGMAICFKDISDTYLAMQNYGKAQDFASQSLQEYTKTGTNAELARAYINLGIINKKNHLLQRAITNLEQGINISSTNGGAPNLLKAYKTLYDIYNTQQNFQKALHYNMLAHLYQDSLSNLEIRKKEARIQIEYENQQKEDQILMLHQQNKLTQLSMKQQHYWILLLITTISLLLVMLLILIWFVHTMRQKNIQLTLKNTEIERVRNELEKNRQELLQANIEAERNTKTKNRFLAHISHEIRTPLNSVLGFTELLSQSINTSAQKNYVDAINAAGKSLLNLLNNILDFAKYDNSELNFKSEEVNIREVLSEVQNIFLLKAREKDLQLNLHFVSIISEVIIFNQMVLQQILLNLVGNAIKYTEEGSVEITILQKKTKTANQMNLVIKVKDTGPGIPAEDLRHIFEPFYQGTNFSEAEGAGLGLSITHTLVKKMGGLIEVNSSPEKGTEFSITFKKIKCQTETPPTPSAQNIQIESKIKTKLLFINQQNEECSQIKNILNQYDFEIQDVGLRLAKAKKFIDTTPLIILCCLDKEEQINTLNIIDNLSLKKQNNILILQRESGVSGKQNNYTSTIKLTAENWEKALRDFIVRFKDGTDLLNLFESQLYPPKDQLLDKELHHLYDHEFIEAFDSRLLDKIEVLTKKLDLLARKYKMPQLHIFAEEVNHSIQQFDIGELDKKLNLLKKTFVSVYHFK
ncbi:MAG: tetratricopeptide repeat-containing sensor histidine kinase [Bacteroidales bacterium]|nr:tetratricopeptide repeat-containing sensor histidine kinase [Bacteroidales bacterium]